MTSHMREPTDSFPQTLLLRWGKWWFGRLRRRRKRATFASNYFSSIRKEGGRGKSRFSERAGWELRSASARRALWLDLDCTSSKRIQSDWIYKVGSWIQVSRSVPGTSGNLLVISGSLWLKRVRANGIGREKHWLRLSSAASDRRGRRRLDVSLWRWRKRNFMIMRNYLSLDLRLLVHEMKYVGRFSTPLWLRKWPKNQIQCGLGNPSIY